MNRASVASGKSGSVTAWRDVKIVEEAAATTPRKKWIGPKINDIFRRMLDKRQFTRTDPLYGGDDAF